jgi:tetratricopeptide (TPR) repeat protein
MGLLLLLLSLAAPGRAVTSPYQLSAEAMEQYNQARYREAEAGFRRAFEAWGNAGPAFARDRAIAGINLGTVLRIQGRYGDAERLLADSLHSLEAIGGPNSLDAARAASGLAVLYQTLGRIPEAETLAARAHQVFSREPKATESDRANGVLLLASVYLEQKRHFDAESLLHDLLNGPESRHAVRANIDLAAAAIRTRQFDCAGSLASRAVEMAARVLPENHPLRAAALNNLAQVRRFQERYLEAETHYREAIAIWEASLGASHPDTAKGMLNLAALHHERGRERLAETLYRQVAAVFQDVYGMDHELTLVARAELAEVLRAERRYTESKRLAQATLPALETRLGAADPRVVRAFENYQRLLQEAR